MTYQWIAVTVRADDTITGMTQQRPPLKKWQMVAGGVVLGVCAIAIVVGVISEKNAPTAPTPAAATTEAQAEPRRSASESAPEPQPTQSDSAQTMTVENSEDLAALLAAVEDHDLYKDFAAKHQGKTIEFDGIVAALNQHGDYKTRYDILIFAGDSAESGVTGPNFQFNDVNIVTDLHLTGSNIPDTIGVGQKLHIVAMVESYSDVTDLFQLDSVSVKIR